MHTRNNLLSLMEPSEIISEYAGFWDSKTSFFAEDGDLCSWNFEDSGMSGDCSSNLLAPDDIAATPPATPPKNIIMERERRRKFNKKLYDLRSVVPSITKMNKASTVLDAIKYIQDLQEEERLLVEEESAMAIESQKQRSKSGKKRTEWRSCAEPAIVPSIEVMEVNVRQLGNGTSAISIICSKKRNAIVRVCELVESLHLRIITVNISSRFQRIFYSIVVEVDGEQSSTSLKEMIEAALKPPCQIDT